MTPEKGLYDRPGVPSFIPNMTDTRDDDNQQPGHQITLTDVVVFKRFYETYYRSMKYFGLQYVKDEEVVADLMQDVWLKLWERQSSFTDEESFKGYLFRAYHHTLLNYIKHHNIEQEFAAQPTEEEMEEEISCRMIEAETHQIVSEAFGELSDSCRRVYAASLNGDSQKEIADRYHITINTVKKHINNANHYLRSRLRHLLDD